MRIYFYYFFIFLFSLKAFGKEYDNATIDQKLVESSNYYSNFELIKSIKLATEASELSINADYIPGKIKSYIYIAKVLNQLGSYNKALIYLEKANNDLENNNSIEMKVESHRLKGIIYSNLNMDILSIKEFRNQLKLSQKISNPKNKILSEFWAYQNITNVFDKINQNDSIWKYLKLQQKILNEFNSKEDYLNFSTTYTQIANQYLIEKKYNNAKIYLDKSLEILNKNESPYLYYTYSKFGDLYSELHNVNLAILYYKKSIENSKKIGHLDALKNNYKVLSDYLIKNDTLKEEASIYYFKYNQINDSLAIQNNKLTEEIINYIIEEEKREIEKTNQHKIIIYSILSSIAFIALIIFFSIYFKKYQIKKHQIKNKIIQIEDKYNESINDQRFEKLMDLIKNNNPEFLVLFKELYPCFITELKKLDPNIRSSELSFCAMLYLNYSTKDISEYTYVTVRAVQIRKNRLRKKYNINSDVDLNKWMRNLCSYIG